MAQNQDHAVANMNDHLSNSEQVRVDFCFQAPEGE